jgi:hypothetical protein
MFIYSNLDITGYDCRLLHGCWLSYGYCSLCSVCLLVAWSAPVKLPRRSAKLTRPGWLPNVVLAWLLPSVLPEATSRPWPWVNPWVRYGRCLPPWDMRWVQGPQWALSLHMRRPNLLVDIRWRCNHCQERPPLKALRNLSSFYHKLFLLSTELIPPILKVFDLKQFSFFFFSIPFYTVSLD